MRDLGPTTRSEGLKIGDDITHDRILPKLLRNMQLRDKIGDISPYFPLKMTVSDENEPKDEKDLNFHGIGGLKGRDWLFLGVKGLFLAVWVGSYHQ